MKGGGEAIVYSSVPCQRCNEIAPPEPKSVDDQMPIIPAPIATKRSEPGRAPALNIRNAIDAKIDRRDDRDDDEEPREGQVLQVEEPADVEEPKEPHATCSVARLRLSRSMKRSSW